MSGFLHPIMDCAAAAQYEGRLFEFKEAAWEAMQNAGKALAKALLRDVFELGHLPRNPKVLLLVGKGHNGGDALLAGLEIRRRLPECELFWIASERRKEWRTFTQEAFRVLESSGKISEISLSSLQKQCFDVAIDGLLGMQFRPPLREESRTLIEAANSNPRIAFRASVDVPSGCGDPQAFRADFTYATGILKTPAVNEANAENVGRLRYLDLGFFSTRKALELPPWTEGVLSEEVLRPLKGLRSPLADKRSYGHAFIVGGSRSMPGALLMNVLGALQSGAGRVTAFAPESVINGMVAAAPEALWVPWPESPTGGLSLEGLPLLQSRLSGASSLLVGSGMGNSPETRSLVEYVLETAQIPVILDADGLCPEVHAFRKLNRSTPLVLTPHPGEFRRLVPCDGMPSNAIIRELANSLAATVVLKGPPLTRVASADKLGYLCAGGPVLARGGSGDILAGMIAAATALPGESIFEATARATLWHSLAADSLSRQKGPHAVRTTELLQHLSQVLRE